jgi:hypothetical protein
MQCSRPLLLALIAGILAVHLLKLDGGAESDFL